MKRKTKHGHIRQHIAQQAAKLVADHGLNDFDAAKKKAAKMLGVSPMQQGILPTHQEIQDELSLLQRLFPSAPRETHVHTLRQKALRTMQILKPFEPRLVGMVLDGTATLHTPIHLHVVANTSEEVMIHFINLKIPYDTGEQRLVLSDKQAHHFPMFRIYLAESPVEITVLPENSLKYTPKGSRATIEEVGELVDRTSKSIAPQGGNHH
jgi:hypothetical protein